MPPKANPNPFQAPPQGTSTSAFPPERATSSHQAIAGPSSSSIPYRPYHTSTSDDEGGFYAPSPRRPQTTSTLGANPFAAPQQASTDQRTRTGKPTLHLKGYVPSRFDGRDRNGDKEYWFTEEWEHPPDCGCESCLLVGYPASAPAPAAPSGRGHTRRNAVDLGTSRPSHRDARRNAVDLGTFRPNIDPALGAGGAGRGNPFGGVNRGGRGIGAGGGGESSRVAAAIREEARDDGMMFPMDDDEVDGW